MPRIPEEILHRIRHSAEEEKHGEEGILKKITLNNERYFAKHWRGKHYQEGAMASISYSPETLWKTPVSPFWFKLKYYEAALVHDALPDLTLRMEAGFDTRISRKNKKIDLQAGRPVTLTPEVTGDTIVRKERDKIIDALYQKNWEDTTWDTLGRSQGPKDNYANLVQWAKTDEEMRKKFGHFLGIRDHISRNTFLNQERTDKFVALICDKYQGTDNERMVRAGVIPVHAEVNYIPTDRTGPNETKGIFIETAIFDIDRLDQAIFERQKVQRPQISDDALRREVAKRIDRYLLLRTLDDLWDEVYYSQKYAQEDSLVFDSAVARAVFVALDRIRERWDNEELTLHKDILFRLKQKMHDVFYAKNKGEALMEASKLRLYIDSLPMIKLATAA